MRTIVTAMTVAVLLICAAAACGGSPATAPPEGGIDAVNCRGGICTSNAKAQSAPAEWIPSAPDITRELLLAEARTQLTDRGVHIIYVLSMMELHHRERERGGLAEALADRDKHESCLRDLWDSIWDATEPSAESGIPEEETKSRAEALVKCATTDARSWADARPSQRKDWTWHLLRAAAKIDNPAERARPTIANETSDSGWVELYEVFKPCEDQTEMVAEAIATAAEPRAASDAVAAGVRQTRECASKQTQRRFPEQQKEPIATPGQE